MVTDPIADLLTRIRNAQRTGHRAVRVSKSSLGKDILSVLKLEGFVEGFEVRKDKEEKFEEFEVKLRYFSTGEPVIANAHRVSRPGKRMYAQTSKLPKVRSGLGIAIVSTSQGVMSDREARKRKIGGEVLALIG